MKQNEKKSLPKLLNSFAYAIQGIKTAFRREANIRIHAGISLLVIIAGIGFGINRYETLIIILCMLAVFGFELINSAIEYLSDRVSTEYDNLIKQAKDTAAAAVLLSAIASVIIGIIIFLPYLKKCL